MSMATDPFDFQPVVVIGAARSGTNMLRDILTKLPRVVTWSGDETNYLWKRGQTDTSHDVLTAEDVTRWVASRVRRAFRKLAGTSHSRWVVEKTCANSLRVGYVHAILPEAKFIFLVRDGRDVTLSAEKCWRGAREPMNLARRTFELPLCDLPYYGCRFLYGQARRLLRETDIPATWGPRFVGMHELVGSRPLDEVCALQWQRSVEMARQSLSQLPAQQVHVVRYEDVVVDPRPALAAILRFLRMDAPFAAQQRAVGGVFTDSVGRWRRKMTAEQQRRIGQLIHPMLASFGYDIAGAAGTGHAA